jgi:hypothetical protein
MLWGVFLNQIQVNSRIATLYFFFCHYYGKFKNWEGQNIYIRG